MSKAYSQFIAESPVKVARGVKLSRFCTMKVGGPADLLVEAKTKTELVEVSRLAHRLGIKYFVLAGGSNTVFPDEGFRGLVVRYTANNITVVLRRASRKEAYSGNRSKSNQRIIPELASALHSSESEGWVEGLPMAEVEAGAMLGEVVRSLLKQNLGGFNFLANIPGSVGGAIVGNAGCYGKETKDVLQAVEVFNVKTGKITVMKPSELGFAYRHSKLKEHPEFIILSATFKLEKVDKKQAFKEIAKEKQSRLDKHPHAPSCGSWFKNPSRIEPAWKFIEAAGMKGATIGGAKISTKHANFLVNYRRATTTDVLKLAKLVKQKVKAKTGSVLDREVKVVE